MNLWIFINWYMQFMSILLSHSYSSSGSSMWPPCLAYLSPLKMLLIIRISNISLIFQSTIETVTNYCSHKYQGCIGVLSLNLCEAETQTVMHVHASAKSIHLHSPPWKSCISRERKSNAAVASTISKSSSCQRSSYSIKSLSC